MIKASRGMRQRSPCVCSRYTIFDKNAESIVSCHGDLWSIPRGSLIQTTARGYRNVLQNYQYKTDVVWSKLPVVWDKDLRVLVRATQFSTKTRRVLSHATGIFDPYHGDLWSKPRHVATETFCKIINTKQTGINDINHGELWYKPRELWHKPRELWYKTQELWHKPRELWYKPRRALI